MVGSPHVAMLIAVRPPEYFPRVSFAALMHAVDVLVLGDTFRYSRQSTQNRARIRTSRPGQSHWLTVPLVSGAPGRPISEIEIAPGRWRQIHRKTLEHHYSSSPFYIHYAPAVEAVIERAADRLGEVTVPSTRWVAEVTSAGAEIVLASDLPGEPDNLAAVLETLSPDGLLTLPESSAVEAAAAGPLGVRTRVLRFDERPRRQNFAGFVPGCSCLDLLLNHGPRASDYLAEAASEPFSSGNAS